MMLKRFSLLLLALPAACVVYLPSDYEDEAVTKPQTSSPRAEVPAKPQTRLSEQPRLIRQRDLCLDVHGGNGRTLLLYECHGRANQQFAVRRDGTIRQGGKCLDVAGENAKAGAEVIAYACHGKKNQQWFVDGPYIRSKLNGLCLTGGRERSVMAECGDRSGQWFEY